MKHLAVIADGNRRWAKREGLPSGFGYVHGLIVIENLCLSVIDRGIEHLSVFCFSTENWRRTTDEVNYIMDLARDYFSDKKDWYHSRGIKVVFRGRKDRLPKDVVDSMNIIEQYTLECRNLTLYIMVDYGGRQDIVEAVKSGAKSEEEVNRYFLGLAPEPDAVIRTGGHRRLSNFMLWQAAYSELFFIDTLFPDFGEQELDKILDEYTHTQKNCGR